MNTEQPTIDAALRSQQVQAHFSNLPWSVGGAAFLALLLAAIERPVVGRGAVGLWLAGLGSVLGLRLLTGWWYRRSRPGPDADRAWLLVYRVGIAAHGLAWGAASLLPIPADDAVHQAVRVVLLAGIAISSFAMSAFDLLAALGFGVPVIGLLAVTSFALPDPAYGMLALVCAGALVFFAITARRAAQVVRSYVALRVGEAARAEQLRSSEELLERTGATAGVGGWELDVATMRFRLTGQAFRIHDVEPVPSARFEQVVTLYAPAEQERIREGLAAAYENGTAYEDELELVTAKGRRRWVRVIGQPHFEGGTVKRISGVVQDVTQTRLAELALAEHHHLLGLLVKTTHEGFWFVDPQAVTTDVNPAMCTILARPREEIVGRPIFDFVDAANAEIFRTETQRRDRGVASGYEVTLLRADGSRVDCFNNATPILDTQGRRLGSIGMFTDITERKRAEHRLRVTSEQLAQKSRALQVTLDSISQGIANVDTDQRLTVHNRRLVELLELPEALFHGGAIDYNTVTEFQDQRGDMQPGRVLDPRTLQPIGTPGDHFALPHHYLRRTPGGRTLEVRSRHLADGTLVRTFSDATEDIALRQGLAQREGELRALLDAFPGFIAMMSPDHTYGYVNEAFAALVGRPPAELIGQSVREVLGAERFERVVEYGRRARRGERVVVESDYPWGRDGERVWLQVTHAVGVVDADGRANSYAFGVDISARKVAEQALLAAKEEAERANRAKSQFLSSMSHELRTPMNAIIGFGQLLMSDTVHPLAGRQRDQVREMLRGARHLLELINEVLDLTLVEAGKLRISLEPVDLGELLTACLALMRPLARDREIEIVVPDEVLHAGFARADRTRLKQVLLNLLSNAIKYNRPRGEVRLACRLDDDSVRLEITDTGPGLDDAQGRRLFEAFERLDAARTQVEGAGLGLALSKRLLGAMGGEIGLHSTPGAGSTFWIRLARATAPMDADAVASAAMPLLAAPAVPGRRRRVLYIEDNPVNVLLMEAILGRLPDLELVSAALPEVGLRMAIDERPDLILLDIQLPGIDGFTVLQRLRGQDPDFATPVIAVSANAMPSDVARGLAAGFARYLTKPLDLQQVVAAVDAALARA